jgi:hypothetical protein
MNFTDTDGGDVAERNEMLEPDVTTVPSNRLDEAGYSGQFSLCDLISYCRRSHSTTDTTVRCGTAEDISKQTQGIGGQQSTFSKQTSCEWSLIPFG